MSSYTWLFTYSREVIIYSPSPFSPKSEKMWNVEIIPIYVSKALCYMPDTFLVHLILTQFCFKDEKIEPPGPCPDTWLVTPRAHWLYSEQGSLSGSQLHHWLLYLNIFSFFHCSSSDGMVSRPSPCPDCSLLGIVVCL